jgi:hypothetical protein
MGSGHSRVALGVSHRIPRIGGVDLGIRYPAKAIKVSSNKTTLA